MPSNIETKANKITYLFSFKYCYLTFILFDTIHSFAHCQVVPSICKINNFLHAGKRFQVSYTDSFICKQLNDFKYCFVTLTIQLNMSFVYTQINVQRVLFLTIRFNISHLYANTLSSQIVLFDLQIVPCEVLPF